MDNNLYKSNIDKLLNQWGIEYSKDFEYLLDFEDYRKDYVNFIYNFISSNETEVRNKYGYCDIDFCIIYTALFFNPLFNKNSVVGTKDGHVLVSTDSIMEFSVFSKNVMRAQNLIFFDDIMVFKYNQILNSIENCVTNLIRWNSIADDWDILRAAAYVRDLNIYILFNETLRFVEFDESIKNWLRLSLQVDKNKFYSKIFN